MFFSSPRWFEVLWYQTGSTLVIRSPDEIQSNIDLVFLDVDFIQLRSMFTGISLHWEPIQGKGWPTSHSHVARIESEGEACFVAAAGVEVYENKLYYLDGLVDGTADHGKLLMRTEDS